MDRNEPVRLSAALGTGDLNWTAQTFGGGGNGAGAAVTLADAAISAGYAECVVAFRSLAQGQFARYGQAGRMRRSTGAYAFTAPYGMLTPAQTTALQTMRFMHDHGVSQDALAEVALASYAHAQRNPRADPLRHAADPRGVPRLALDRRAVPPLRLLPGERRRGGDRRHDGRAGPRPAPAAGRHRRRRPRPRARRRRRRVQRRQLPDRPPPPRRAPAVGARRRRAGRRAGRPVLRELHRPGADGDHRDGLLRARGARTTSSPTAASSGPTGGCRSTPPAATSARRTSTASATSSRPCARCAASRRARSTASS